MNAQNVLAVLTLIVGVLGAAGGVIVKLTRLVTAVEQLGATMEGIVTKLADHEGRLHDLEHTRPRR